MHIIGIANGTINGNIEIVLKAALKAAQQTDKTITTSWVHIPSVSIPLNPKPLAGTPDISIGSNKAMSAGVEPEADVTDDRQALLDALLDSDAFIIATPIYSHTPAGFLKGVLDRILGPFTDVVFATQVLEMQKSGDARFAKMKIDQRLFKPRVAGFMCVGGSTTPDQINLALPTLHTLTYPMHVKVVDQVIFQSCGTPGSILARVNGAHVERAAQLGENVASQLDKKFDDAKYLGGKPEGACPYCHLAKVDLFYGKDNKVGCVGCGAEGNLSVGADGIIRPTWNQNCGVSSITWASKLLHIKDIQKEGPAEQHDIQKCVDFDLKRQHWRDFHVPAVVLLSQQASSKI